jgi:Na+/melibiose symporter-like transporter
MRAKLLVLASTIGSLGWGAVLPYQYAYAADTRHWGALVAASASSLFSVGALVAAPLAGRLADRFSPVLVAVAAQLLGALAVGSLVFADNPTLFFVGMLVFGLGLSAAVPAKQLLALTWSSDSDRRKIFAYKFTGESLGMAAGAFLAGLVVDLGRTNGLDVAFLMAAAGFVVASGIVALAGWIPAPRADALRSAPSSAGARASGGQLTGEQVIGHSAETGAISVVGGDGRRGGFGVVLRAIVADRALRWTAIVTVALALGFYAQYESGLPAYALTDLKVDPSAIGTAAAVNCIVIVILQVLIVKVTAKTAAPALLMAVGGIWVLSWLILASAQFLPGVASALFVTTYGVFAVGETIYSPVLNPLTASLAPAGMVGQTLGVVSALQTAFSAAGPLVAGVLLGAGLGGVFLGIHLAISAIAVFAAWRVKRALDARAADKARVEKAYAAETVRTGDHADVASRVARHESPTRPVAVRA